MKKTKRIDPIEVFQVLGAAEEAKPEKLEETARQVGASPEVVEFMEKLPGDVTEPSEVVAAASDPKANEAGVELELPHDENEVKPELTIDDVTAGEG
ncbi:MAG TPA: hypothetical protein VGH44_01740 [Candidatus Saccharimonadia bacterium]|jgi:hypothetical protein